MPRSQHLHAKVCRPRLAQLLARERLFSRLDEMCAAPVIWICGAPGAGKTSLAASYLDARHLPALWYQVDAGDGDLGTFFSYLARAADAFAAIDQAPLPRLTPEYFADIPGFARRFFRLLFERLPRPAQVILDNFQEASDLPAFSAVVREAVPQVPADVNLIIVSRNEPGEPFARYRGSRSLEVLGWEELRLTQAEAHSIALGATGLDETKLGAVLQRAHGWPAGLVLLIEALNRGALRAEQPLGSSPEQAIFDYLASELLAAVPAPMRDMLARLAHLTRFSAQVGSPGTELEFAL